MTERAGGVDAFVELVDRFYERVEADEVLRPMYPEDLAPGKRHLALFFAQYWGAGDVYSSERGHPRLRMRHAGFPIDRGAALRWATHMAAAIRSMRFPSDVEHALLSYVSRFTPSMINRADDLVPDDDGLPQE
ncbi:MAG: globin [Actinobacteria bacterium]|nr:globin [Actinomycetota bacterium]